MRASHILFLTFAQALWVFGEVPVFPQSYTVKGVLTIPYAEITEPFQAWYDGDSSRSRIDYYNGMVKTLQFSKSTPYGVSLKYAPMTTEERTNVPTCFQVNGTEEKQISIQGALPDLSSFKNVGSEVLNGFSCEKWTLETEFGEKVNRYVMYIRREKSDTGTKIIPVRYEMRGFNSLLGSHFDHYYLDYNGYSSDKPKDEMFVINPSITCTSFPGPGVDHVHSFNPMQEFIHNDEDHVQGAWELFKNTHNKEYDEDNLDHHKRKEIFRQNVRFIYSKNRANTGYQLSVNHLADKTDYELKTLNGMMHTPGYNGGAPFPYVTSNYLDEIPEHHDWRLYGAVTPVKDQSICGSCWSYGTTGTMEGAYFVKTGKLLRLSEQALVDCSWGYGNNGCDGGENWRAYQWIKKHGGLPLESDYGDYLGEDGYCHIDKVPIYAPIKDYVNVTSGDENALKLAIFKHGPVGVSIYASQKTFSFYSNGIYYDPGCKNKLEELNHAVLAVGFGKINDETYWLLKNSWSNLWGNDGYILISTKDNNCGVMTSPTYVIM